MISRKKYRRSRIASKVIREDYEQHDSVRLASPLAAQAGYAKERAAIAAQHGPVRVLWRDGKKVEDERLQR